MIKRIENHKTRENYCKKNKKGDIIMSKWEEKLEQDVNKFNKHKKKYIKNPISVKRYPKGRNQYEK